MIVKKPLLSENIKDFMDYSLDTIKAMDGAPEHTATEQENVNAKIAELGQYLENVKSSYNENIPQTGSLTTDSDNFSGTGHS